MNLRTLLLAAVCATLPLVSSRAEEGRPILVFGSGRGVSDINTILRSIEAQATSGDEWEIVEGGDWVDPEAFTSYGCVVLSTLDETKTRPWTTDEISKIHEWISSGGRLLVLGGSAILLSETGTDLSPLEAILGAKHATKTRPVAWMNQDEEFAEVATESAHPWMDGGTALRTLTHMQPIVGWSGQNPGVLFGSTAIGEGKVLYLGVSPSHHSQTEKLSSIMSIIKTFLQGSNPAKVKSSQSSWGTTPLGAVEPIPDTPPAPTKRELKTNFISRTVEGFDLILTDNGKSLAVIVLPPTPSRSAKLAAEELQAAFHRISGCHLPILDETAITLRSAPDAPDFQISTPDGKAYTSGIFLGDTRLGRQLSIQGANLPPEAYRLRTSGNALIISGNDQRPDGSPLMGTYFGAVALLERHFGVRWLWPGELGEVYPRTARLYIPPLDEQDAPALAQRKIRNAGGVARLSMEPESADLTNAETLARLFDEYKSASSVRRILTGLSNLQQSLGDYAQRYEAAPEWFRRQKLGGSFRLNYTHAYDDYYERYGENHPEWFAMQPDGSRKQVPERPRLCKSNVHLTDTIAENILAIATQYPNLDSISISPNDGGAKNLFCMCEDCRRLDPPNAPSIDFVFTKNGKKKSVRYPALTDRVVDFYNRIAESVAKQSPNLKLGAYAYSFYRTPPLQRALHPNVIIGFVGTGYFDDHRLAQDRQSWEGWANRTNQLFLRPNALHLGHGFPGVFVHKLDRDIKHFYQTGMIGADYDSIVHHWSTQGLNYYVLAKLLWDPSQKVDDLIDDYCKAAFGSAAETMRNYFAAVEEITNLAASSVGLRVEEVLRDEEITDPRELVLGMFLTVAPDIYTSERLQELQDILNRAKNETDQDPEAHKRIEFVANGLEYARLQSALYRLVQLGKVPSAESEALMQERQKFFKQTFQDSFFSIGLVEVARREVALYRQHPQKEK